MQVQTIDIPQHKARKLFLEYRNAVRERLTEEDQALMEGYRVLARGAKVINVITMMRNAGLDEQFRPKLAITRADAKECLLRVDSGRARMALDYKAFWDARSTTSIINFPVGTFPFARGARFECKALVPSVPLRLRPKGDLKRYHILWEAEWGPIAPVDPLLLRIIRWPLFAIVAQWDLTELERSILEGRL